MEVFQCQHYPCFLESLYACKVSRAENITSRMSTLYDELNANWELLSNGEGYFKIEPLH